MASIIPPTKHGAFNCQACGQANRWPKVRFCTKEHPRGSPDINATTMSSPPAPHLHRTCGRCKREDIIPTFETVER